MQQGLPLRFGILARTLLEPGNRRLGNQHAAMQANEVLRELFFEMRERFVEQILPAGSSGTMRLSLRNVFTVTYVIWCVVTVTILRYGFGNRS